MANPTQALRQQLAARPRTMTYEDISRDTGLSYHWLVAIARGGIRDAGANKVEVLRDYLEKQPP